MTASVLCLLISRGDCEGKPAALNTFKAHNFDSFPGFLDKPVSLFDMDGSVGLAIVPLHVVSPLSSGRESSAPD